MRKYDVKKAFFKVRDKKLTENKEVFRNNDIAKCFPTCPLSLGAVETRIKCRFHIILFTVIFTYKNVMKWLITERILKLILKRLNCWKVLLARVRMFFVF